MIMMPFILGAFQNANSDIIMKFDAGNSDEWSAA